jgi:hypothetical protein
MKWTTSLAAALCAALAVGSASAAITTSVTANSTTGIAGITSWPNPFNFASPAADPSSASVAETNYGGASLYSLAQSFVAPISGNLSRVQLAITGTAPVTFNVAVFDALAFPAVDVGAGTYAPGSNVSNNLLTTADPQTWTGYTLQGANAAVLDFSLSGSDQVSVTAGKTYIFEVSSTSNLVNMGWFRTIANAPNGQAFRQRAPLNGNNARDMALAATIVPVPEPSCLVLGGLAALALATLRRRS